MINVSAFVVGWLVYLYGQAQNSVRSKSNGLSTDSAGLKRWLLLQHVALVWRAFFSAIFYPALVQLAIERIEPPLAAAGLRIAVWGFAALAGFTACGGLNQLLGLIPALRAEVPNLVPPTNDGTQPPRGDQ